MGRIRRLVAAGWLRVSRHWVGWVGGLSTLPWLWQCRHGHLTCHPQHHHQGTSAQHCSSTHTMEPAGTDRSLQLNTHTKLAGTDRTLNWQGQTGHCISTHTLNWPGRQDCISTHTKLAGTDKSLQLNTHIKLAGTDRTLNWQGQTGHCSSTHTLNWHGLTGHCSSAHKLAGTDRRKGRQAKSEGEEQMT